ncbi:MAG: mechanosensitive ion channel family protein [Chthoniobacteraceae bacterium]
MTLPTLSPARQAAAFAVAAPLIYLATVALGRFLKRKARVQLGVMYQLLGVALGLYIPLRLLGWDVGQIPGKNAAENPYTLRHDLAAACILLGVVFLLSLLKRYLWEFYFGEKRGVEIPKFLREIMSAVFFCVALLIVFSHIYDIHPSGVLLSSTVVVGIVGWAMQDLLGNVISGVALQLGKPFKAGDWLVIDPHHAEVIEVNWRSTRLRTNDDTYLDVPNSSIVRSTIVNLSYPSHLHAMRMRVGIDCGAPPNKVKQVLFKAALGAKGVLAQPPPKVFLVDFADSANTYEIKYWLENHAAFNEINDALRTAVWYALQRAGIAIPFPMRTVQIERKRPTTYQMPAETRTLIRQKPFFKCMTDAQFGQIVGAARPSVFGKGERVVEQGADGSSMFVLLTGDAAVFVGQEGNGSDPTRVATLQPGDYFGEMSLLTGEKRSATVTATSDCEVLEIAKTNLAQVLQENSELLKSLSEMLAQRRLDNEGLLASSTGHHSMAGKKEEYARGFLQKLAWFFEL